MKTLAQNVKDKVKLTNTTKVLDIDCGAGLFGIELCDNATELVGVDTSNEKLNDKGVALIVDLDKED